MSVAQTYILTAAEGQEEAMQSALLALAEAVRPIAGCESVAVLRDQKNARRFLFIETFANTEAHKASGSALPKDAMAPLMATIDGKPEAAMFDYVAVV